MHFTRVYKLGFDKVKTKMLSKYWLWIRQLLAIK
jgi:hypothetical protein